MIFLESSSHAILMGPTQFDSQEPWGQYSIKKIKKIQKYSKILGEILEKVQNYTGITPPYPTKKIFIVFRLLLEEDINMEKYLMKL